MAKKYQALLSFRGEDTRNNFTSHLYAAFLRKGIDTFLDNQLIRGEELSQALLTAIEESTISIIVLSENYAFSSLCLDELSKILECKQRNRQIVVPIFYHVDPNDVRYQKGSFEEAFAKHQERFKDQTDKIEKWKAALVEVAALDGHWLPAQHDRLESTVVEEIAEHILKKLMYKSLYDTRIEELEQLLCIDSVDVRIVGIFGMGGIGKTTTAEAVYNRFFAEFDGYSFLNVRELKNAYGKVPLREKQISEILGYKNLNLGKRSQPGFINDGLHNKKVLIVLDDVDSSMQLDLLPEKHCFGPGSRIIVISRDKQVLQNVVDEIYKVEGLDHSKALQMFSFYAFKQSHPKRNFMVLSKKMVHYAEGVPLALKVLGSALYGRSKSDWQGDLNNLKGIPNHKIHNVLRINYDGLDGEVKDIFLDIACFFKGMDRDYVADILDGCYSSIKSGIGVLIDKSLLTISHNMLEMHDLLQKMAWNMVYQVSKEPAKRSRLWNPKEINHVLMDNTGFGRVEGALLDMSKISQKVFLSPSAFGKMYNLRLLKFYYSKGQERKVHLSQQGLTSLPNNLTYLHWDDYPSKCLPLKFCPENLIELSIPNSCVEQLWDGVQNLVKLKTLDLSGSQHLIKIPDVSQATNLVSMKLDGCRSLVEVPSSIQYLNKLGYLTLQRCKNLGNFPGNVFLRSLTTLLLDGCSNITKFPEISESLETLSLSGTAIEEVPSSIGCFSSLTYLDLGYCRRLERLPSCICKLKFLEILNLEGCLELKSFPEILETMESLMFLSLNNTSIEELPSSIEHLVGLKNLELNYCAKLINLPSSIGKLKSLEVLSLRNCSNITKFPKLPANLEILNLTGTAIKQGRHLSCGSLNSSTCPH